ncbi:MAG: hypothetical protein K5681_03640, partial [Treponema sp.]|nr:hypothetical protein [Treponema sp.]
MHIANITLDIYNIIYGVIVLFTILGSQANKNSDESLNKLHYWFDIMVGINILMSAADFIAMLFIGNDKPENFMVYPIAIFVYYVMGFLLLAISLKCAKLLLDNGKKPTRFRRGFVIVYVSAIAVDFIFLIITLFTGLLYSFDENNNYLRGNYFYLMGITQAIIYLDLIIYLLVNKKESSRAKLIIIISFILLPQIAQICQVCFPGLSLINTGYAIVFNIMFIFSMGASENRRENTEIKLVQSQDELQDTMTELERKNSQIIKMQDHTIQ